MYFFLRTFKNDYSPFLRFQNFTNPSGGWWVCAQQYELCFDGRIRLSYTTFTPLADTMLVGVSAGALYSSVRYDEHRHPCGKLIGVDANLVELRCPQFKGSTNCPGRVSLNTFSARMEEYLYVDIFDELHTARERVK